MGNLSFWIPQWGSWVRAIAIGLLCMGLGVATPYIMELLSLILRWLPPEIGVRLWGAVLLVILLAPIGLIALAHHWSHRVLDQYIPETRLPETEAERNSILPTLSSWWEGLYGWFTAVLSTAIATCLLFVVLLPGTLQMTSAYFQNLVALNSAVLNALEPLYSPVNLLRVLVAAYLYHIEEQMRRRLMTHPDP